MKFSSADSSFVLSSYSVVNLFLVLAYPALRVWTSAGNRDLKHLDSFGFTYENSVIYMGLVLWLVSFMRSTSLRGFLIDSLVIVKVLVAALLFMAKFYYCLYYVMACVIAWIVLPYPRYNGSHNFLKITSEEQFDGIITQGIRMVQTERKEEDSNALQYSNKFMCFLEFYTDWMLPCIIGKELWYNYSLRYSTSRMVFLQINADRQPQLAKRFSINVTGFTKQLPTVIILQNGKEVVRFPIVKDNKKVDRVVKLDYKVLLSYFDLESRYLETREMEEEDRKEK